MNGRQLAQKWPLPRHNLFEKKLRTAASKKNVKNRGSHFHYINIFIDEEFAFLRSQNATLKTGRGRHRNA